MTRKIFLWTVMVLALAAFVLPASAVVYVDINATGAGDGTSWIDAYTSLDTALNSSLNGSDFWVAAGTYATPVANGSEIKDNHIYGGYPTGGGTRNVTANPTILDGGGTKRVLQKTTGGVAILDGLTIQNGLNGSGDAGTGGGVNVSAGTLQMASCVVKNNTAGQGGGIYCAVGTYTGCTFDGNRATTSPQPWSPGGGAIFCGGSGVFTDCVFTRNYFTYGTGYGTVIRGGDVTLVNCTMEDNGRGVGGGYLINCGANQSVGATNCVFSGNTNCIGILASYYTSFYVDNCLVTSNNAPFVYQLYAGTTVVVKDTSFINNSLTGSRYAPIYSTAANNTISGCVFVGNTVAATSANGAMIFIANTGPIAPPTIDNCTFVNNSTAGGTGAIGLNPTYGGSTANITDCVFYNNTGGGVPREIKVAAGYQANVSNCDLSLALCTGTVVPSGSMINPEVNPVLNANYQPTNPQVVAAGQGGEGYTPPAPPNSPPDCSGAAITGKDADANCQATITAGDVTGVTDPDNDTLTITVSPTTLGLGANAVTVSADDGKGGTCSKIITVTVTDKTAPAVTAPADATVACDAVPEVPEVTATDNCDGVIPATFEGEVISDGDCAGAYTLTRTWSAKDASDNQAEPARQVLTVVDGAAPVIACDPKGMIQKGQTATFTATATDNCSGVGTLEVDPASVSVTKEKKDGKIEVMKAKDVAKHVTVDGASVTIAKLSEGWVVSWTVVAADSCGKESTKECSVTVVKKMAGDDDDDDTGG